MNYNGGNVSTSKNNEKHFTEIRKTESLRDGLKIIAVKVSQVPHYVFVFSIGADLKKFTLKFRRCDSSFYPTPHVHKRPKEISVLLSYIGQLMEFYTGISVAFVSLTANLTLNKVLQMQKQRVLTSTKGSLYGYT